MAWQGRAGQGSGTRLAKRQLFADAGGHGAFDGIAVDELGNVWSAA